MTPKKHDPQASPLKSSHVCINGKVLVFDEPAPEVAAFVDRVRAATSSKKVSQDELIALIYGSENPLLSHTLLPGYSMVTPEVFANPVYRVLTDLLDRKRIQLGLLDPVKAAARYTLSIPEAAEQMGVHRNAIVNAIDTGKLPVWVKGDRYFLDPATLHAYEPEKRGASPRLQIRFGNMPGMSFRVKAATELDDVTEVDKHVREGVLSRWKRIAVIARATKDEKDLKSSHGPTQGQLRQARFYVLEPASTQDHLKHGPFGVEGRFQVVEKTNNAEAANAAWTAFKPA